MNALSLFAFELDIKQNNIVNKSINYIIRLIGDMGDRGARGPIVRGPKGQPGPPGLPGEYIFISV